MVGFPSFAVQSDVDSDIRPTDFMTNAAGPWGEMTKKVTPATNIVTKIHREVKKRQPVWRFALCVFHGREGKSANCDR